MAARAKVAKEVNNIVLSMVNQMKEKEIGRVWENESSSTVFVGLSSPLTSGLFRSLWGLGTWHSQILGGGADDITGN